MMSVADIPPISGGSPHIRSDVPPGQACPPPIIEYRETAVPYTQKGQPLIFTLPLSISWGRVSQASLPTQYSMA